MEHPEQAATTAEAPKAEDKKPPAPKKAKKAASKPKPKAKPAPKKAAKPKAKKKAAKKAKKLHPMLKTRNRKKSGKKKADFKETLNIKVLPPVAKQLKAKADKLTNGNFTVAVVKALLAWKPNAKEVKALKETRKSTRT